MSQPFNLTAQLNLRGPANVKQIGAQIRKDLGNLNVDIKFKIDPSAAKNVAALNGSLKQLNVTFASTVTSAQQAAAAIKAFGGSVASVNIKAVPQQLASTSSAINKIKNSATSSAKGLAQASTEMQEFGKQAGLAVRRFAAFSAVTSVIYGVTNSISQGIQAFIDYDRELVKLQQVTGESSQGLAKLQSQISTLAVQFGVSSKELTTVALTLAQAGLSARDTERSLKALALSSLAPSFDSMNETVEGSIALMRQFGIAASDLEAALGSVNTVAAQFAVEASDIITAIQRTGSVFATASKGVSEGKDALNEFIAVFTSVRATTRESAETIATGLRTIFTRIQRGSTIDALKEFGVNLTDAEGKFVGAYKAVELLSKGLSGIDPRSLDFSRIVEELGGFRQIGKVIPLIQQFSVAQEALKVAQRGQGSLAKDAATAQLSLANKIVKVREEFFALFREIGASKGFQTIARGALDLTSGLIKLTSALKGILPALTVMLAFKGARALTEFASGFVGGIRRGPDNKVAGQKANNGGVIRRFARGGVVPGSGDGDTVPAMLMPGEFVIRKKAVQAIGADKLHDMNKYGDGGSIGRGRSKSRTRFAKGGLAQLASIDGDFSAVDGDTFDAKVTPKGDQFIARFRVNQFDTYETKRDSLVSKDRAKQIMALNPNRKPLKEKRGRYVVPKSDYIVTKQEMYTAEEAAYAAKDELAKQMSSFIGPRAAEKTSGGGGAGRYLAKTNFKMPDRLTTGRKWDEDGKELNRGGIVQKFMAGGEAQPETFGTGATKFPKRITNAYAKKIQDEVLKNKSDKIFGKFKEQERKVIDETQARQVFASRPFDKAKFVESFKNRINRDTLYEQMSDFAKFIGLPQEDLSLVLPQTVDFVPQLGAGVAGHFQKYGPLGSVDMDLSRYGFTEADNQDLYGYKKLLEERQKSLTKILKTPIEKFDDGSFSYDTKAAQKEYEAIDDLNKKIFDIENKKSAAEKAVAQANEYTAKTTGRGSVGIATAGINAASKSGLMYHELTHQLINGLRVRSAESFDKYKARVNTLFSGDNDGLADAFDALEGSYNSADIVYGRSYKNRLLNTVLSNLRGKTISTGRSADPELSKEGSALYFESEQKKKAREYRPINPKMTDLLLKGGITQDVIDRVEDSGKEEFLTTLIQKSPELDSDMTGILNTTLNELLGSVGIQRQNYAKGGKVIRKIGVIDTDVLRDPANAEIVRSAMESLGISDISDYSIKLSELAAQARKKEELDKFIAIAGAAGSGKSSLAMGRGANDIAELRETSRIPILSPSDITGVNQVISLTSTASQKKLDAYLKDVDRAYVLSSNSKAEQDLVQQYRDARDMTGVGLYGRKPGTTRSATKDFGLEETILREELGDKAVVLGRKSGYQLRRKKSEELPEIVQAGGFYTGGFAPPTVGHAGALQSLLERMIERDPNASLEDILVSIAPNLPMVEGKEGLAHAARYGIFPADFRALMSRINFGKAMLSQDITPPGGYPKYMEVMGSGDRRKFARLKGALAVTSGKDEGVLGKYERAGIQVKDIPRIDDISATDVRTALFNGDDATLAKTLHPDIASVLMGNRAQLRNRSTMVPMLLEEVQKVVEIEKERANQQVEQLLASLPPGPNGRPYRNVSQALKENHPDVAKQIQDIRSARDRITQNAAGYRAHSVISLLSNRYPEIYGLDPNRKSKVSVAPSDIQSDEMLGQIKSAMSDVFTTSPAGETVAPSGLQEAILKKVAKETAVAKTSGILPAKGGEILKRFRDERFPRDITFGEFAGKTVGDSAVGGKLKYWNSSFPPATNPEKLAYYIAARDYLISKFEQSQGTQKAAALEKTVNAVMSSKQLGLVGLNPLGYTGLLGPETWDLGQDANGQDVSLSASIVQRGLPSQYQNVIDYLSGQTEEIVGGASKLLGINPKKLTKKQRETLGQGNIEGALLEQIFGSADATILDDALRTRPIDFPMGIGAKAAKIFGIDPDIPTEVKRTIDSNSRAKAVEEFQRYFRQQYGIPEPEKVQKFAGGGQVELIENSGTTYHPDDVAAVAKKHGMTFEELKAKLTERHKTGWQDYVMSSQEISKLGLYPNGFGRPDALDTVLAAKMKKEDQISEFRRKKGYADREYEGRSSDEKSFLKARGYALGGKVKLYHGSNTGIDDNVLKSFKEKGALSNIATGYGQGAGFYLYTEKSKAEQQARMRVDGGSNFTLASGDRSGKPMVLSFEEVVDPKTFDLDYELQKGLIVEWLHSNYDKLKDKYAPSEDYTGLKGKLDKNPNAGIMSVGVRIQEGSQTLKSESGEEFVLPGGSRKSIYAGSEGDVREGALIGQLMNRIKAGDPDLLEQFESKLFEKPLGLALKYVGSSPLKPINIETFATGGRAGISKEDTVPALLTPGEFVINKKAAQKIGYNTLHKLNHADKVQGYNKGGTVGLIQKFASGGAADTSALSRFINVMQWVTKESRMATTPQLEKRPDIIGRSNVGINDDIKESIKSLTDELEKLGLSASNTTELLKRGGDISYKSIEKALVKDIERLKISGASIDQIVKAEETLAATRKNSKDDVKKRRILENGLTGTSGFRNSASGKLLGSGAAQQDVLLLAKEEEKQRIEKFKKQRAAAGLSTEISVEDRQKIKERSLLSAASSVTGVSRSDLKKSNIGASDIQKYIAESMTDRKTLAQMDKQLIKIKQDEVKNSAGFSALSKAEQDKRLAEAKKAAQEEISIRREIVNDLAAEKGQKGVGAAGFLDFRNSPILKMVKNITASQALTGVGLAAGAIAGQGQNIAKVMYRNDQSDNGQINIARAGAAIEKAGITLAAGLTASAQMLNIPIVGPWLAGLTALGTAAYTAVDYFTDFTGAQKAAALEMEKSLRTKQVETAMDDVSRAFDALQKDVSNLDLQAAFDRAIAKSATAGVNYSYADTRQQENNKAQSRSWLEFFAGAPVPTMTRDETDAMSRAQADKMAENKDKTLAKVEMMINSGKIKNMSDFTPDQIRDYSLAYGTGDEATIKEVNKQVNARGGASKVSQDEYKAIFAQVAAQKFLTSTEIQAAIKSKQLADALEAADRAGRKMAQSFERLFNSINDSINRIDYESDMRRKAADAQIAGLNGQAQAQEMSLREINVLDNRKAYQPKEFNSALDSATAMLPAEQGKRLKDAAQLEANLGDVVNASIATSLKDRRSLTLEEASDKSKKAAFAEIDKMGLAPELAQQIKGQIEANMDSTKDKIQKSNLDPQAALDKFAEEVSNSGRLIGDMGKQAIETAKKLLTLKQNLVNNFIKGINQAAKAAKEASDLFKKAKDIRRQGAMNVREVTTGVGETFEEMKARRDQEIAGLTGGLTDPTAIRQNIQKMSAQAPAEQAALDKVISNPASTDKEREAATSKFMKFNESLNNSKEALDKLADSTELAEKALSDLKNVRELQKNRESFVNTLLTNTPEEADKLNQTFIRLQRNLSGGLNGANNQRDARKAFNETLRQTGSVREATKAGNTVLANQRKETLSLMQDPGMRAGLELQMRNSGMNDVQVADRFKAMETQLMKQMAVESGQMNNPLVRQAIAAKENPNADPAYKQAANRYLEAQGLQAKATEEQAQLKLAESTLALKTSNDNLRISIDELRTTVEAATNRDQAIEGGQSTVGMDGQVKVNVAAGKALGGLIYASEGQFVNFQPQGTDTVPAMLSPGEFVINAKSTSEHLPLLKAINSGNYNKGGVVYLANGGQAKPQSTASDTITSESIPVQKPLTSANSNIEAKGQEPKLSGPTNSYDAFATNFFAKPKNAAEVGMYKEGLARGMTIDEIKYERQQRLPKAILSRLEKQNKLFKPSPRQAGIPLNKPQQENPVKEQVPQQPPIVSNGGKPETIDLGMTARINEVTRPTNAQQQAEQNAIMKSGIRQSNTTEGQTLQKPEPNDPKYKTRDPLVGLSRKIADNRAYEAQQKEILGSPETAPQTIQNPNPESAQNAAKIKEAEARLVPGQVMAPITSPIVKGGIPVTTMEPIDLDAKTQKEAEEAANATFAQAEYAGSGQLEARNNALKTMQSPEFEKLSKPEQDKIRKDALSLPPYEVNRAVQQEIKQKTIDSYAQKEYDKAIAAGKNEDEAKKLKIKAQNDLARGNTVLYRGFSEELKLRTQPNAINKPGSVGEIYKKEYEETLNRQVTAAQDKVNKMVAQGEEATFDYKGIKIPVQNLNTKNKLGNDTSGGVANARLRLDRYDTLVDTQANLNATISRAERDVADAQRNNAAGSGMLQNLGEGINSFVATALNYDNTGGQGYQTVTEQTIAKAEAAKTEAEKRKEILLRGGGQNNVQAIADRPQIQGQLTAAQTEAARQGVMDVSEASDTALVTAASLAAPGIGAAIGSTALGGVAVGTAISAAGTSSQVYYGRKSVEGAIIETGANVALGQAAGFLGRGIGRALGNSAIANEVGESLGGSIVGNAYDVATGRRTIGEAGADAASNLVTGGIQNRVLGATYAAAGQAGAAVRGSNTRSAGRNTSNTIKPWEIGVGGLPNSQYAPTEVDIPGRSGRIDMYNGREFSHSIPANGLSRQSTTTPIPINKPQVTYAAGQTSTPNPMGIRGSGYQTLSDYLKPTQNEQTVSDYIRANPGTSSAQVQNNFGSYIPISNSEFRTMTNSDAPIYGADNIFKKGNRYYTLNKEGKYVRLVQQNGNGPWVRMNKGGIVYASNGALAEARSGQDTVPAMLTPGEFVVNRDAAQQHMPLLHSINSGHFNRGGAVNYLANGGIVAPKYYANAGPVTAGSGSSGGVSNDISSSISAAVGQAMNEAVGQLSTTLKSGMETYSQMMQSSTEKLNNFGQTFASASQTIASSATTWSETASQIPNTLTAEITGRQEVKVDARSVQAHASAAGEAAGHYSGAITSQNTMAKYDRTQFEGGLNSSQNNQPMRGGGPYHA